MNPEDASQVWLTVDEAVAYSNGAWSSRQSVLAAIQRGHLQAENLSPLGHPRRFQYRLRREWVDTYLAAHGRRKGGDGLSEDERVLVGAVSDVGDAR